MNKKLYIGVGMAAVLAVLAGVKYFSKKDPEAHLWTEPAPTAYNFDMPVLTGSHSPSPLPEVYEESLETGPQFTLEQILKDKEEHPNLVEFMGDLASCEFILGYFTAKPNKDSNLSWCPPCDIIKGTGLDGKLQEWVNGKYKGKVAIMKFLAPGEAGADRPSVLLNLDGVPHIIMYKRINGKLYPVGAVDGSNWEAAVENTLKTIDDAVTGRQITAVRIDKQGFRDYKLGFSVDFNPESPLPIADHYALFVGYAMFGSENTKIVSFDRDKGEFIFDLDLANELQFWFGRGYNADFNARATGRNILSRLSPLVMNFSIAEKKRNPYYAAIGKWINGQLSEVWKADATALNQAERHRALLQRLFNFGNECRPLYIAEYFDHFVTSMQAVYKGEANEYHYITDLMHPVLEEQFKRWAESNGKRIMPHSFPSADEISGWVDKYGLTQDQAETLQDSLRRIKQAYGVLRDRSIIYADPLTPAPVLQALIDGADTSLVLSAAPQQSDIVRLVESGLERQSRVFFIEDILSDHARNDLKNRAQQKAKTLTPLRLPAIELVKEVAALYGLSDETIGSLSEFMIKIQNGEIRFDNTSLNLAYKMPMLPPLLNLLSSQDEAVLLTGSAYYTNCMSVTIEGNEVMKFKPPANHEYLWIMMDVSQKYPASSNPGHVNVLLPYHHTRIGFVHPPDVGIHSFTDAFANGDYLTTLLLFDAGVPVQRFSNIYYQEDNSPFEALTRALNRRLQKAEQKIELK